MKENLQDKTSTEFCQTKDDLDQTNCLRKLSSAFTRSLEASFFHVGHFVGEYPVLTIIFSFIICGLSGIGLKTFHKTEAQEKIWVPKSSRLINEKVWIDNSFPDQTRFVAILLESSNSILTPEFLKAMVFYYDTALEMNISGLQYSNFCVRIGYVCSVQSILELWDFNSSIISHLNQDQILDIINNVTVSPLFGYKISTMFGGRITYSNGRTIGATGTKMIFIARKDPETESMVMEWEKQMIDLARRGHKDISQTYVYASRSFHDEGYGAVDSDIKLLTAGFIIVFVFVFLSLGKFNLMEQKIYLSLAGMLSVGLSILFAYGLATAMDLLYNPINSIMPFMLLGIGVDDMFVVIEVWKNLSPEVNQLSVPNKIAMTLKQAGVSITVTSLTDAVAFGVGASTAIPALSSFCVYAVLGILALFVLVATFFAACLSLDERRRRAMRDACIVCYRHTNYTPNACSQNASFLQIFFSKYYGPFLMKLPVKVLVIVITLGLFGVNIWSFTLLKQDFQLESYIPSDTYAYAFFKANKRLFDKDGEDTGVYCGQFSYLAHRFQMEQMYDQISQNHYIQNSTIIAWFKDYHFWLKQSGFNLTTEQEYVNYLHSFLNTKQGGRLSHFIIFDNKTSPTAITASFITMRHVQQGNSAGDIEAMDSLRSVVDKAGLPLYEDSDTLPKYKCFAYSQSYMTSETNKVLYIELLRNLGLSGACVLIVTCVVIANLWTSIMVFVCVIFTVVNVAGSLQFWGVTVDTASSILLTLSVGLAVDYSAHVGHTFMTISGPRSERTVATLRNIGPAVFNGGFSTFLAFILLADSNSYGFVVFFRVFTTVVLFGLFHGLAFLPVLLSLFGPDPYLQADIITQSWQLSVMPYAGDSAELVMVDEGILHMQLLHLPTSHANVGPYSTKHDHIENSVLRVSNESSVDMAAYAH